MKLGEIAGEEGSGGDENDQIVLSTCTNLPEQNPLICIIILKRVEQKYLILDKFVLPRENVNQTDKWTKDNQYWDLRSWVATTKDQERVTSEI